MDVLLGTTNPSKAAMFENGLAGIRFLTLRDVSIPGEPEENGATPAENARRKAEYYGRYADYVICNDSGLYLAGLLAILTWLLDDAATIAGAVSARRRRLLKRVYHTPSELRRWRAVRWATVLLPLVALTVLLVLGISMR